MRGHADKRWRLLIVDDEPLVLRALARSLGKDYEVTTFPSSAEALHSLTSSNSWDAILSDMVMPGMDGVEFARRAVAARPDLAGRIMIMTGGTCTRRACSALEQSGLTVIAKPIDLAHLRALFAAMSSGPDQAV